MRHDMKFVGKADTAIIHYSLFNIHWRSLPSVYKIFQITPLVSVKAASLYRRELHFRGVMFSQKNAAYIKAPLRLARVLLCSAILFRYVYAGGAKLLPQQRSIAVEHCAGYAAVQCALNIGRHIVHKEAFLRR